MHEAAKLVKREELLRLLLCGMMLKECAKQIGLSYWTVRKYASEKDFLEQLKGLSKEVHARVDEELRNSKEGLVARLEEVSEAALEEMWTMAQELSPGMAKLKALQDLMDRDGRISRQRKEQVQQSHSFVDPLFLVHAAGVAKEIEAKQLQGKEEVKDAGDEPTD